MVLLILCLRKLNIEKPKFVEIGVGDYTESNTRFLFLKTAKGLIIDCLEDFHSFQKMDRYWQETKKFFFAVPKT